MSNPRLPPTRPRRFSTHRPLVVAVWLLVLVTTLACACLGKKRDKSPSPTPAGATPGAVTQSRSAGPSGISGYQLDQPDARLTLPPELAEVSGLTNLSDREVACVQDEEGTIFVYDLSRQQVTRKFRFGEPGDYEGLTFVEPRFFVLRSDGLLFEVSGPPEAPTVKTHALTLPITNNEGLGFDEQANRLLIAPKGRAGKGSELKNQRWVFAFDLASMQFLPEPVYTVELEAIEAFAAAHGLSTPKRTNKHGTKTRSALRLLPSSIAVHPKTQDTFVLSAVDHVLISLRRDGTINGYARLDPILFPQPEGMTFLSSGELLIGNEAAGGRPTLLRFGWKGLR